MKLVVGLGNPGAQYENTRHNIGFEVAISLAESLKIDNFKSKFQGKLGEGSYLGEKVLVLMPHTFMNLSGNSIIEAIKFYKLNPEEDVIVVYDDMDLNIGKIRIREKGSSGGHNGVKSIISHIGERFIRIKCGIGKPESREQVVNFVLSKFGKSEKSDVDDMIEIAKDAIKDLIEGKNIEKVMLKYN